MLCLPCCLVVQDYGLHLMLEERADYWKWSPTAAQNDPQVQELLHRNIGTEAELVSMERHHACATSGPMGASVYKRLAENECVQVHGLEASRPGDGRGRLWGWTIVAKSR